MKLLSCAAQFRRICIKIKHEMITEELWSIFTLRRGPALQIHTHIYVYIYIIYVSACLILNISISSQVSEIFCFKETGVFIDIHETVQKFLEQQ